MRKKKSAWGFVGLLLAAVWFAGGHQGVVQAVTSESNNYQMSEAQFGAGSMLNSCSNQYCAKTTIGNASGEPSTNGPSTAIFSTPTDTEPRLEVIVDPGVSHLGELSTETTATKTITVRVNNYLTDGYALQIIGAPPKFGSHTLKTPSSPTASRPGTEQFAINAAANTAPSVGAGALQVPSGQTIFGAATDDYKMPNVFKYTEGDVVARSNAKSGRTDYTISMIVNIAPSTPAGHYTGDFAAVVTPAY